MKMLQEKISAWLSRPVPERAVNQCFDLPVVLATDIGLQRSENQDRVAALKINTKATGARPVIAIAVADGMGGMRDGAKCAVLALSSFFNALALYRSHEIESRAIAAISYANDAVFKFSGGKGGATLSAVLLDHELRPFVVNLGDSRIYSFGDNAKVERLTIDDSLAEAVGGHGRELLQFVGMGEGMQPHVNSIPSSIKYLAITTDGIHFVDQSTLENILSYAPSLKSASERLTALARWSGGPDNASSALVELQSLFREIHNSTNGAIELWDPFGSLMAVWLKADDLAANNEPTEAVPENLRAPELKKVQPHTSPPKAKSSSKKPRREKKDSSPKEDIQLEIKIERSDDPEESDENSR